MFFWILTFCWYVYWWNLLSCKWNFLSRAVFIRGVEIMLKLLVGYPVLEPLTTPLLFLFIGFKSTTILCTSPLHLLGLLKCFQLCHILVHSPFSSYCCWKMLFSAWNFHSILKPENSISIQKLKGWFQFHLKVIHWRHHNNH